MFSNNNNNNNSNGGGGGGNVVNSSSSTSSSSLMGGNSSLATSNSGIENDSSVKHTVGNDQSKSSIEQPVLPKSISQIGGNVRKCILLSGILQYFN